MENSSPMADTKIENPEVKPNTEKLSGLAQSARAIESEGAGFMEPGTKVKRGPGRPKKDPTLKSAPTQNNQTSPGAVSGSAQPGQPVQPVIPTAKIVRPVITLISKTGARIVEEPKAEMSPEEFDDIATAAGLVLEKWMPTVSQAYGAELYLAMGFATWGTRLMAIRAAKKAEKEEIERLRRETLDGVRAARPVARTEEFDAPIEAPRTQPTDFFAPGM